ncbi:MAG: spore germination protein [Symbiobacteriia bacterium]
MGLWRVLEQWFPPEPETPEDTAASPAAGGDTEQGSKTPGLQDEPLGTHLRIVRARLEEQLGNCSDLVWREFRSQQGQNALLLYVDGLVAADRLERDVVPALLDDLPAKPGLLQRFNLEQVREHLAERALRTTQISIAQNYGALLDGVLAGDVALALDGLPGAIMLNYRQWERRQPEDPPSEPVVRGPREGFTESLRTNTALVRRRLRTPDLKLERLTIGSISKTDVVIVYLSNIADSDLVEEVRRRLARIRIDAILESGYLEEFIEDQPYSPFSQVQNTERPDIVAAALLEGRVAILTDNTPFVLIVPATFLQLWQANEDYYERFTTSSAIRLLRYFLLVSALILPSLYIAVLTHHPEMIPTHLLLTIAAAREPIPFPTVVEVFLMEIAFEGLREAGLRLPRPVGSAVSIVGALVIGQAAVQAGIASAPTVIIVAITGISSFAAPRYNAAISHRLLRFPLMVLAAFFGLFGVMAGLVAIVIHLSSLRSLGVSYLSPGAPLAAGDLKDILYRAPWWAMRRRPQSTARKAPERVPPGQRPRPSRAEQ